MFVKINIKELTELWNKMLKLEALEDYGVDNWEGYCEAMADIESVTEQEIIEYFGVVNE